MSLWSRISNAVRGERLNREIEEELQSHIEEAIASGRDPEGSAPCLRRYAACSRGEPQHSCCRMA
jgi:hypothetical protein